MTIAEIEAAIEREERKAAEMAARREHPREIATQREVVALLRKIRDDAKERLSERTV